MDQATSQAPEPNAPEAATTAPVVDGPALGRPAPAGDGWFKAMLRDVMGTIVPAIIIALLIHVFLAQARVYGQSMEPNLHTNERLVIGLSYHFHGPRREDVVVLR